MKRVRLSQVDHATHPTRSQSTFLLTGLPVFPLGHGKAGLLTGLPLSVSNSPEVTADSTEVQTSGAVTRETHTSFPGRLT